MSQPRPVLPGAVYLITRRTSRRTFWLTPSAAVTKSFRYCLAVAAARYGVEIHAFCVMSNHFHIVLTDVEARLPAFMEWLNGKLARALNRHYAREENLWSSQPYHRLELIDRQAVLRAIVYTLTNPVSAGLVERYEEWPGAISRVPRTGGYDEVASKPGFFFRRKGPLPDEERLSITRPRWFDEEGDAGYRSALESEIEERQERAAERLNGEGRSFLGRASILRQSPEDSPATAERERRAGPLESVALLMKRLVRLDALRDWVESYRIALERFSAGVRDVVFPAGTYLMRIRCGVECEMPEPP